MTLADMIARWSDPGFQADLQAMSVAGVDDPVLAWFLLPILEELHLTSMLTFTGRKVSLVAPDPNSLDLGDICHHLALENRFNGATREPYSVAQHAVWCWEVYRGRSQLLSTPNEFTMVLHDAPEAYLKDFPRALKRIFRPLYSLLEDRMWWAMCRRWPALLIGGKDELMEEIDLLSSTTEQRDLFNYVRPVVQDPETKMHPDKIIPKPWRDAEMLMVRAVRILQARMA